MLIVGMDKSKTTVALRQTGFWDRIDIKIKIFLNRLSEPNQSISYAAWPTFSL